MTRSILTFETVFQVLAAEKILTGKFRCRTVPTPALLSTSICGMSIELLELERTQEAAELLIVNSLKPHGIHSVD